MATAAGATRLERWSGSLVPVGDVESERKGLHQWVATASVVAVGPRSYEQ